MSRSRFLQSISTFLQEKWIIFCHHQLSQIKRVTSRTPSALPCMASSEQRAELKQLIREALQEEQACSSGQSSAVNPKTKAKSKGYKTVFDETRTCGPDLRDPRMSSETWPCYNQHAPQVGNNRFGRWSECSACGVRMSYTPAKDAPGQTTHADLPQNVTEALHRLRSEEYQSQELTSRIVKAMITIVAKEKILVKKGASAKAKTKAKAKAATPLRGEAVGIEDSDEDNESGFSMVTAEENAKRAKDAKEVKEK